MIYAHGTQKMLHKHNQLYTQRLKVYSQKDREKGNNLSSSRKKRIFHQQDINNTPKFMRWVPFSMMFLLTKRLKRLGTMIYLNDSGRQLFHDTYGQAKIRMK